MDITGVDVGVYVQKAQKAVADNIQLLFPIVWSGQYEYTMRVKQKLKVVVPATLFIIFLLRRSLAHGLDGVQHERGGRRGLHALAGVAAETGLVMLTGSNTACMPP